MKERDMLIELLVESSKKVGEYIQENDNMDYIPTSIELCGVRADFLLENGVVVPEKRPRVVWTGLSERQREIVQAFADNNMNATETANNTYTHRNTVIYHLGQVAEKTGLDPHCFRDLNKLLSIIEKGIDGVYDER